MLLYNIPISIEAQMAQQKELNYRSQLLLFTNYLIIKGTITKMTSTIPPKNCTNPEVSPSIRKLKRFFLVWVFPTNASSFFILYRPYKINTTPKTIPNNFKAIIFNSTYYTYIEVFLSHFLVIVTTLNNTFLSVLKIYYKFLLFYYYI